MWREEVVRLIQVKHDKRLNNTGRQMVIAISGLFLLFFLFIGYHFVVMAITGEKKGQDLYQYALNVYLVEEQVQGKRGTIYDREGIALAEQLTSYTLYANLYDGYGEVVEDIKDTAQKLSTVISLSAEEIEEILSKDRKQVEFGNAGRQLTYLEKEQIEKLELKGIKFIENIKRFYPNGVFASHTLGYTKWDESQRVLNGEMGIELYFDEYLQGSNGRIQYLKDKKGYVQPNKEEFVLEEVKDGLDIYLTLDSTIQTLLEEAMDNVWEEASPKSIVAVVANPKTGEIVAMGSRSSFDPNIRDIENYNNPILSDPFEPGSTMKIYTYAAAINEGKYNGSQYYQSGSRLVNGATIRDYNQSWGTLTYDQGFYRSSNTAIIDLLTNSITPDENIEYFKSFGFGSTVGLPLPSEHAGTLPADWDLTQKLTAGFGQGILTTPIQHIQAITAILNDGNLIKPQLIEKVYDPNKDEVVYELEPEIIGNPITAQTAQRVKDLMIGVIEAEDGSGRNAYSLSSFTSGGKTGTAQVAEGGKGYLANEYIYSYIGFAPADDPELVMYLAMDRPTEGGHDQLGKIYRYVMQTGLTYLGAEKTQVTDISDVYQKVEVEQYINETTEEAIARIKALGLEPIEIGSGSQVFSQSPLSGTSVIVGSKVFIQSNKTYSLPDFTGWTRDELVQFASLTGLKIQYEGEGYVTDQSIPAGETINSKVNIIVTLQKTLPKSDEESEAADSPKLDQDNAQMESPSESASEDFE